MNLHRLVLTFKREGLEVRALYKRQDGPNPGTKARRREVAYLARDGLERPHEAGRARRRRGAVVRMNEPCSVCGIPPPLRDPGEGDTYWLNAQE